MRIDFVTLQTSAQHGLQTGTLCRVDVNGAQGQYRSLLIAHSSKISSMRRTGAEECVHLHPLELHPQSSKKEPKHCGPDAAGTRTVPL